MNHRSTERCGLTLAIAASCALGCAASPDGGALGGGGDGSTSCAPSCGDGEVGADECGDVCSDRDGALACSAGGDCVDVEADATSDTCAGTCASLGFTCGDHCGAVCGACDPSEACVENLCQCARRCDGKGCLDSDGCGGTCGPCPSSESCAGCALRLWVAESEQNAAGRTTRVHLALDFAPPDEADLPAIADLRLKVHGQTALLETGAGEALLAAGKDLYVDGDTGKPYRVMNDGTLQFLVIATDNTERIGAGRWLTLDFAVGGDDPVVFQLAQREETFAPPSADAVLWGQEIDGLVVVWPGGPP